MSEQEFLARFKELLETEEELQMDMPLDDILEWDSMHLLNFMGMCAEEYGKHPAIGAAMQAETVRELYELAR